MGAQAQTLAGIPSGEIEEAERRGARFDHYKQVEREPPLARAAAVKARSGKWIPAGLDQLRGGGPGARLARGALTAFVISSFGSLVVFGNRR